MTHPTEGQIEAAIKSLRAMIAAAEASNQAGEDAVMAAAAGPALAKAAAPLVAFPIFADAWHDDSFYAVRFGDLRTLAAAAAKATGQ